MAAVSQAALTPKPRLGSRPARCRGRSGCVLYPGVGAVPGVQPGVLPGGGVDGQGGVAVAVGLFDQVELGAGCGRSRRTITRVPAG